MKNKIVSLFGNDDQNEKYAVLLNELIKPFEQNFPDDMDRKDIVDFSMNVWNFGNMRNILPTKDFNKILAASSIHGPETGLFKKMIERKVSKFSEYDLFIADFKLDEDNGVTELSVRTIQKEEFLDKLMNDPDHIQAETDFEQGYINRFAIVIKPKKPFFDWINKLQPDHVLDETGEANIYLVSEEIDDLDGWLKRNFNKFFVYELENEIVDKRNWPPNRNFKMFKQWFNVDFSTMIFDLEKIPVYKED